jgi:hypothetical protein
MARQTTESLFCKLFEKRYVHRIVDKNNIHASMVLKNPFLKGRSFLSSGEELLKFKRVLIFLDAWPPLLPFL